MAIRTGIALFIAPALAWFPLCAAAQNDDRAVIHAVLTDFAERSDTMSMHEDGILLLHRHTGVWTRENYRIASLTGQPQPCAAPFKLQHQFYRRNLSRVAVTAMATRSARWRLLSEAEREAGWSRLYDKTASGEAVKTIVALSRPGYAAKGKAALVMLSFHWSIQGAHAKYVLRKTGRDWKVSCANLIFYP